MIFKHPYRSFLTGSHAYDTTKADSDIDLVVFLTEKELGELSKQADVEHAVDSAYGDVRTCSLRFGKHLNLICITDAKLYEVWRKATAELRKQAPVSRYFACVFMDKMRNEMQIPILKVGGEPAGGYSSGRHKEERQRQKKKPRPLDEDIPF